jgi:hypothetical protein
VFGWRVVDRLDEFTVDADAGHPVGMAEALAAVLQRFDVPDVGETRGISTWLYGSSR